MRTPRLSFFGYVFTGFAFLMPVIGLAQTVAAPAPAAPSFFAGLVQQYAPWLVGVLIAYFLAHTTGIIGFLQSKRDAADSSAGVKALAEAGLLAEHLAETFAAKIQHDLMANPALKAADLLPLAGNEAKATLSGEAISTIEGGLGVVGTELGPYLQKLIASKLGGAQLSAATSAANAASAKVQAMPLNAVAAGLTAKPS